MNANYKNSYKSTEKELVSLAVYNVGYQKCSPQYQWGPGVRDHYLIHHVTAGKGCLKVKQKTYGLNAGDSFLIYPGTEAAYMADEKEPWEYAWVGFNGSDAPIILKATDFAPTHPVIADTPYGKEIAHQFLHIYDARGNDFESAVEMTGRLYTALALYLKGSSHVPVLNTYKTYVQKAIEYIAAHYSYPITVEDIADYVGLSRSHMFRSFENVLQISPKEYLSQFRIKQACYLLQHTDLSITAIANSVGFESSLYFSKAFKKAKGMAPREYKRCGTQNSLPDAEFKAQPSLKRCTNNK